MGKNKIPPGDAPDYERVQPERIGYTLWYVPEFPLSKMGGKLDKDPSERPWIMGLLADIRAEGRFRNPVIVWNHHPMRGRKQPFWLLRAGSNRVWCAEQLGWTHVPAIVSTDNGEIEIGMSYNPSTKEYRMHGQPAYRMRPEELQEAFTDGGNVWANEHGFGLLRAKPPEVTYARYIPTSTELSALKSTNHDRSKLLNPLVDDDLP